MREAGQDHHPPGVGFHGRRGLATEQNHRSPAGPADALDHLVVRSARAVAAAPDDQMVEGICWASRGAVVLLGGEAAAAVEPYARGMVILARLPHAEPAGLRALWPLLLASLGDHRAA